MESGRNPYAAGIVALALAFHRAPVRHPDLLHGRAPLPAGVDVLLKLAGGSAPDPATAALAPAEDIRAAARFFIEQMLLHHDASHYRVLGLEPGAPVERIKEHYRLLMRVFHPDREADAGGWKDAFAIRINLAYTMLHDPGVRSRYDATLEVPRPERAPSPAHRAGQAAKRAHPEGLPPALSRHLPQWVLGGIALLAVAAVGAVYLGNPRPPAAGAAQAPFPATPDWPDAAPAAETPVGLAEAPRQEPAEVAAALAPLVLPAEAPPVELPERAVAKTGAAAAAPASPPAATTREIVAAIPAPAPTEAVPPAPPIEAVAPAVPAAAEEPAPIDPSATLRRFVSAYERGDTQTFMALFDDVAIAGSGGKPQIRSEHEALFRSTDLRRIDIEGMSWVQQGDGLRGTGRYQATSMPKGELKLRTESGTIRIELQRRGDEALIMGLDYQPGERS